MAKILKSYFSDLDSDLSSQLKMAGINSIFSVLASEDEKRIFKNNIVDDFILSWTVRAKNLLARSCGEHSYYFRSFADAAVYGAGDSSFSVLKRLAAIFYAAKKDYEKGYALPIDALVRAEIFGDELEQAEELLRSGYVAPAAVIAGIVLETTVRGICDRNNIQQGKVEKMSVELTKAGLHTLNDQKKITALYGIRNSAAHGGNDFSAENVESMIADVKVYINKYVV